MSWWVILLYVLAITLLGVGVIWFFVLKNKKDKKRLEKLKKQDKFDANRLENVQLVNGTHTFENKENFTDNISNISKNEKEIVTDNKTQNVDTVLEDFSLDNSENGQKKLVDSARNSRRGIVNFEDFDFSATNFSKGKNYDFEEDLPEGFEEDDENDIFSSYEDYLKKNNEIEDLDNDFDVDNGDFEEYEDTEYKNLHNDTNQDADALQDFDFSSLEGKNEGEIADMIQSLPPKAKEILMADILGRKDDDK